MMEELVRTGIAVAAFAISCFSLWRTFRQDRRDRLRSALLALNRVDANLDGLQSKNSILGFMWRNQAAAFGMLQSGQTQQRDSIAKERNVQIERAQASAARLRSAVKASRGQYLEELFIEIDALEKSTEKLAKVIAEGFAEHAKTADSHMRKYFEANR